MINGTKKWFITSLVVTACLLIIVAGVTIYVDPYFHYHKPYTDRFFYTLDHQRNQNDGITRQFGYDAIITGTSMVENTFASEVDALFDVTSVKVTYSGATLKETADALERAFQYNPDIKVVIRGLDRQMFFDDKDAMFYEEVMYPSFLYNDDATDDYQYLFNRDVFFRRTAIMMLRPVKGEESGITSFDRYSYWMPEYVGQFGKNTVLRDHSAYVPPGQEIVLTEEEIAVIRANVQQNVIDVCQRHPDTVFYLFIPPYSAAWWGDVWQEGALSKMLAAEQIAAEMILTCDNARFHVFDSVEWVTTDLNNYKDPRHYGEWINTWMLQQMSLQSYQYTTDIYMDYIDAEYGLYNTFDYNTLFEQADLEDQPAILDMTG